MTTLPSRRCLLTLAAVLAGLLPGQTMANDRDLRATTIPPALCTGETDGHFDNGFGLVVGALAPPGDDSHITVRCALPLNNVDLRGTTNDNDMSSFSVFYQDADGFGKQVQVFVHFYEVTLSGGQMRAILRCSWRSNFDGTGSTAYTSDNVPCVVDLAATAFYHFIVGLEFSGSPTNFVEAAFGGIRFP